MSRRLATIALIAAIASPSLASAQHEGPPRFFAPFFSLFGGGQRAPDYGRIHAPALRQVPEITVRPPSGYRYESRGVREDETPDEALGARAFCVRSCDGFYFPAGPATGGSTAKAQGAMCARLCPASEVSLYSTYIGGEVADAIGPGRQRYSQHPNAFRFRSELSPSCTCNGRVGGGLAAIAASEDFTLRRGDIVAGSDGPLVFSGGGRLPFKPNQFTAANTRHLGREMMRRFTMTARNLQPETSSESSADTSKPTGAVRVVPLNVAIKATD